MLPESFEENTIEQMLPGDRGYTVPWAMFPDQNRVLWINGHYTIDSEPFGTGHMLIERTKTGVIVYQNTIGDHKYQIPSGETSWSKSDYKLPVEQLR